MQLISKYNKGIRFYVLFLFTVSNYICSEYIWDFPLKDKKSITITNLFQKILVKSKGSKADITGCKPNKIWVDKGSKFYNRSNDIMLTTKRQHKNAFNTHLRKISCC